MHLGARLKIYKMEKITSQKTTNSKSVIPAWYFIAFGLRMKGLTFAQIAEYVRKHPDYVRSLFARSGAMYEYWREHANEEQKDNTEAAMDMIFGHLPEYTRAAIVVAKNTTSMIGVAQRDRLFDYALGKPEDRIKLNATVGVFNFTDWALAQAEEIKEYENAQRAGDDAAEIPEKS